MFGMVLTWLLNILFPPRCAGCRSALRDATSPLCDACNELAAFELSWCCGDCGGRIPCTDEVPVPAATRCHPRALYIVAHVGQYCELPVRRLVWQLKFKRQRRVATFLVSLLAAGLLAQARRIDLVTAIPLSPQRERERGFNQSTLVARLLAQQLSLPYRDVFIRRRHSVPQSELAFRHQRQRNVAGSFSVLQPTVIAGKRLLLVDDVYTTGATLREAATVLRDAGARSIICVVFARAR